MVADMTAEKTVKEKIAENNEAKTEQNSLKKRELKIKRLEAMKEVEAKIDYKNGKEETDKEREIKADEKQGIKKEIAKIVRKAREI